MFKSLTTDTQWDEWLGDKEFNAPLDKCEWYNGKIQPQSSNSLDEVEKNDLDDPCLSINKVNRKLN